jgi:hypothetical protein
MISLSGNGGFTKTEAYLQRLQRKQFLKKLDRYGKEGVNALASGTPVDSGKTASSWTYEVQDTGNDVRIIWSNTNTNGDVNIAVILQYGHGTGTGGYVQGRDYINPAIKPVMDSIADRVWTEVCMR